MDAGARQQVGRGALWLYRVLLHASLPFAAPVLWLEARLKGKRRPALMRRLVPPPEETVQPGGVWLQAVSVGEVELARRVLSELRARAPELPQLLTATTATGLDLAERTLGSTVPVLPFPLDLPRPTGAFLDVVRPRLLALVETELWPEVLHQAKSRGVACAVINGRLSAGAYRRYRRLGRLLAQLLAPLDLVLARSDEDGERFVDLGVPPGRVHVVGNIKYDLEPDPEPLEWGELVKGWAGTRPVVVAGSTMDGEDSAFLDAFVSAGGSERAFLILAPRHPERADEVARLLADRGLGWVRRSQLQAAPAGVDVLLIDTIGELSRAYGLASVAFIGGSLVATGGHNPLEPAVWGVPVISGPHVHNFAEVYEQLLAAGGARLVDGPGDLAAVLDAWLTEPATARAVGAAGEAVVERNRGATGRTVEALLDLQPGADG